MVLITEEAGKLIVSTPYVAELPQILKNMGGEWNGNDWVFENNEITKKSLKEYLSKFFRFTVGSPTATAIITVNDYVSCERESVRYKGFVLATARGRDTGAQTGRGVKFLSGDIGSSGSVKNWRSYVDKGTRFLIEDFPTEYIPSKNFSVEFQALKKTPAEPEKDFSGFEDKELINELIKRGYIVQKI